MSDNDELRESAPQTNAAPEENRDATVEGAPPRPRLSRVAPLAVLLAARPAQSRAAFWAPHLEARRAPWRPKANITTNAYSLTIAQANTMSQRLKEDRVIAGGVESNKCDQLLLKISGSAPRLGHYAWCMAIEHVADKYQQRGAGRSRQRRDTAAGWHGLVGRCDGLNELVQG